MSRNNTPQIAELFCVLGISLWLTSSLSTATAADTQPAAPSPHHSIAPTSPADCQGFDEAAGVWRNAPWRAGMPLGGIGCGKFELLPSGWFGRFTLNHNWDMPQWEEPFVPSRGTFLAVSASDGMRRVTRWLRHGWPENELTGAEQVRCVEFRSLFPFAEVAFADEKLPVRVNLRAWSPLVPHNTKDSSLPVAFFELTLENPLNQPVEVGAMMSLENFVGIGGVRVHEGKQRWYFADGSSQFPVVIRGSTLQGLRFLSPRQFEGIGKNVSGEYLLLTDGPTTDRGWDALGDGKSLVEDFRNDGELNGQTAKAIGDKVRPAGALCRKILLPPHAKQTVYFVVVWWMPHHVTLDLKDHGHYYQREFRDSEKLAAYAFNERERLARETGAWPQLIQDSNLPAWLKQVVLNSAAPIFSNTLLTRGGEFAMQENPGRGEGALGTLGKRPASDDFCRTFFPELDRAELELFRACQQPGGEMPQFCGNVYRGVGNTNVWGSITGQPGLACVYVTEVLKHYRVTGDRKFLDAFWPGVKKAVAWERAAKKPPFETLIAEMDGAAAAMARIENEPELAHELETEAAQQHLSVYMIPTPHSRMWPEGIHRTYERIYRYNKSAWGLASTGNAKFAKPPVSNESDMYTLGECMLLLEVTGAYLDAPGGRLMVSPQLLPGMTELHAPVFFARFWGWLDCNAQEFRLKIVRHFGEPLELRELAADAKAAPIRLPEPFVAREGAVLDLSPWRRELWMTVPEPPLAAHEELRWSRTGIGTLLWNATASSDEPFPPSDAFDGYPETRWETPAQGRMSDWFQLDLGKVTPLERIEAMTTPNAKLRVEFSSDGQRWQTLPTPTTASTSGVWGLDWFSGPVRFLKMVPARDMNQSWVIREISAK